MKALKIVGAIVAVLVIGLVIFVMTFDISKYKGLIQDQAKAATGRDVAIGDIRMGLSLTPTIVLKDVSVANAPWGSRPQMVIVKSVEAKAELLPLLSNQVNISKIVLDGADVLLETNKQGKPNWEFDTAKKDGGDKAGQQNALNVSAIDGSNLKVTMKDGETGGETDMSVKSVALRMSGPMQQMNISSIAMNDAALSRRQGKDTIQANIGKVAIESSGPIMDMGFKKIDVSDVKVSGQNEGTPLNAEVSKLTLDEKGALDLQARYNGGDIRAKGTVAAVSALKSGQKALPAKLSIEGMGLKGDVDLTVNAMSQPPFAKGTITIPELDMTKFAPAEPAGGKPAAKSEAKAGPMFSNDPLPWDSLHKADADVKVEIGTIKLANGQASTNVNLPIKLQKGQLAMNGASLAMAGGQVVGDVDANANSKSVAIKGSVKNMTAESLAKAYKLTDLITNGPIDLNMDVHGSGASPHAIASSLNGSFIAGMGESRIRNDALKMVGAEVVMQVLSAINPMGNKDPYTVARCAVANLQIANGVANTQNGIALVTDKMQLTGSGKIELGPERVDMLIKPTATGLIGQGIGKIVSAVKVTGPINAPNIGVDAASTAKNVLSTVGGAAMGGGAGGLLGAVAQAAGGGKLFGGGEQKQASAAGGGSTSSGDICAAARNWNKR